MAWATLSFESKTLNRPEKIEVLIPQYGFKGQDQKGDFGVLFVLHGLHKDRKEWLLDSQLPFLTRELPLLVVMPSGSMEFHRSQMVVAPRFTSYSQEGYASRSSSP